jgi:hypothetical protein
MVRMSSARIQSFLPRFPFFPPRPARPGVLACACVAVLLFSATARADPLLVTGGAFSFALDSGAGMEVSGPAFSIRYADSNPEEFGVPGLAIERADPLAGMLPLYGHIRPNASATFTLADGSLEGAYQIQFDLNFLAGSALSHLTQTGTCVPFGGPCTQVLATGPFQLSGEMIVYAAYSGEQVFRRPLVGSGIATAGFIFGEEAPRPFAIYRFQPAAVPEPGTLLLFAAAGAACLCRRKR